MEYRASTTITSPAQTVWETLIDTDRWPEWDPHVVRVEGEAVLGGKIRMHTDMSSTTIPVDVVAFTPSHRMVWRGGLPLGLMTGTRTFTLTEADGITVFELHEVFTGPLVGILGRFMPDLQPSFDAHVEGLRARIELNRG